MSVLPLAGQPDPFADLLLRLSDDLSSMKVFVAPLDDALTIVEDLALLPPLLDTFVATTDALSAMVSGVAAAVDAADVVPGVDVVTIPVGLALTAVAGAMDTLSAGLTGLAGAADVLEAAIPEIRLGLRAVDDVVRIATTQVPNLLNTLRIFDYLLDIAQPVAQMLEGSDASSKLSALVDKLIDIKEAVQRAAEPFDTVLKAVDGATQGFAKLLARGASEAKKLLNDALSGLRAAMGALSPLTSPFRKLAAIMNKIPKCCKDVGHFVGHLLGKIMDETGLSHLVDGLKHRLLDALGFGDVDELVSQMLHKDAVQGGASSMGHAKGQALKASWDDLIAALGAYHTHKDEALKDLVLAALSAITGTPIDVNKPVIIPDWPLPPNVNTGRPLLRSRVTRSAAATVLAPSSTALNVVLVAPALQEMCGPLGPEWSGVQTLQTQVSSACAALAGAQNIAQSLQKQLSLFDLRKSLPSTLSAQFVDLSEMLGFGAHLMPFVESFTLWDGLLGPLADALQDQATLAAGLPAQAMATVAAAAPVDGAVLSVVQAAPAASVFLQIVDELDGWAAGAAALVTLVGAATQADVAGAYTAEIAAVRESVNARASALAQRVVAIQRSASSALQLAQEIEENLQSIGKTYQTLGSHSQVISAKAQPAVDVLARDLDLANGIFDPLSCLLQAFHCVDGSSMIKAGASSATQAFLQQMREQLKPMAVPLRRAFDNLIGDALPLHGMERDLNVATAALTHLGPAVARDCAELVALFKAVPTQLEPAHSYVAERSKGPTTIHDNFMDAHLAAQMSTVIDALAPAQS